MKKLKKIVHNDRIMLVLKFVLIALIFALYITGEHYKKQPGGHPNWYWIVMAIVLFYGAVLLVTSFIISKKKSKKVPEDKQTPEK